MRLPDPRVAKLANDLRGISRRLAAINPGATPGPAVVMDIDPPSTHSCRDSSWSQWTGRSHDDYDVDANDDWVAFTHAVNSPGSGLSPTSEWTLQQRVNAVAYATKMKVDSLGKLTLNSTSYLGKNVALYLETTDPGSGTLDSPAIKFRSHVYADWGGGSAHHTFDWFQRTTVLSATPVNTLLSFGLSMDSETEEVAFYVGWRDSGPKGLIVGPNQDTLFRPGDRANSSEAGRDLYLQSGKPGAGGAKGGIWIQESDGKVAFFGATPVVRTSAYTLTNLPAAARTYPAVTPALADLAALVRAILDDLTAYGMFQ